MNYNAIHSFVNVSPQRGRQAEHTPKKETVSSEDGFKAAACTRAQTHIYHSSILYMFCDCWAIYIISTENKICHEEDRLKLSFTDNSKF